MVVVLVVMVVMVVVMVSCARPSSVARITADSEAIQYFETSGCIQFVKKAS